MIDLLHWCAIFVWNSLCAWRHNMRPPSARFWYLFARWQIFGRICYLWHQQQVEHWVFDRECGF